MNIFRARRNDMCAAIGIEEPDEDCGSERRDRVRLTVIVEIPPETVNQIAVRVGNLRRRHLGRVKERHSVLERH